MFDVLLNVAVNEKLKREEKAIGLVVFSDIEFNEASIHGRLIMKHCEEVQEECVWRLCARDCVFEFSIF